MPIKHKTTAIAYFRTSTDTNIGQGKDTLLRQREAVEKYAKAAGYEIVAEYFDADVKGADLIENRPAFGEMLDRIAGNGEKTIIVETANRFARDLITQETGYRMLRDSGITLIAADSPDAFVDDTPTAVLIRQILGAVSQFEKAMLVAKLKGARDRKKRQTGKCGGRKSYRERSSEMVAIAKRLHRYPVNGHRRSLREIASELAAHDFKAASGNPFGAAAVKRMIEA
jgi:DNA invertase Pin-like site-specific DNA recombinase